MSVARPDADTSRKVVRALRALNGRATRGDLMMATALPRSTLQDALDSLMAEGRVEVGVSESAVLTYRLADHGSQENEQDMSRAGEPKPADGGDGRSAREARRRRRSWSLIRPLRHLFPTYPRPHHFDRKTLQLIRARGGVVSLAELVEHTGLTVDRTRREAERLSELYGGEPHTSWDDHVVYAFPDLVESAHGDFHVREPRPAWARADDPMEGGDRPNPTLRRLFGALGVVSAGVLAWLITFPPGGEGRALILAAVAGVSAGMAFAVADRGLRALGRHPSARLQRHDTLRRYILGYVFETALRGKGVVSLDRTVSFLRTRTGSRWIRRGRVESVLRGLAEEFDAHVSELDGDLFFGFRNVKRQFLASHVQRIKLGLERRAEGTTVFDSGDSELAAAERELEEFDRALGRSPSKGSAG